MKTRSIFLLIAIITLACIPPTKAIETHEQSSKRPKLEEAVHASVSEPVQLFRLLNPLPLEVKVEVFSHFSGLEILTLHELLMKIKREIPFNIAREMVDILEQYKGAIKRPLFLIYLYCDCFSRTILRNKVGISRSSCDAEDAADFSCCVNE